MNSQLDWNYYLSNDDVGVFYEGYRNSAWRKNGKSWIVSERLDVEGSETFFEMNPEDNNKKYPIGVFTGDMFDPNG